MLTFREILTGLRKLEIDRAHPVITHASLSSFGEVHGGADIMLGALLSTFNTVIMPAFTYKTMITPEIGPEGNAITYGSGKDRNRMAEFYRPDMPADSLVGKLAEALRCHPKAQRSSHPILSFAGINAEQALKTQTIQEPLALIRVLAETGGWVLLIGVDNTVNTSIHYAEGLAGRKQFTRWALTQDGVIACPGFPGCSDGFRAISPALEEIIRKVEIGPASILAMPVQDLIETVKAAIAEDPLALLCSRVDCERCNAVRTEVAQQPQ